MCRRKAIWLPCGDQTRPPREKHVSGSCLGLFETQSRRSLANGRSTGPHSRASAKPGFWRLAICWS